jgi:hypothetical protein
MVENPYWEANSRWAGQKITSLLQNQTSHCPVQKI